jgi:transposase
MEDTRLYEQLLGLQAPWKVENVSVEFEERTVVIHVAHVEKKGICPVCGKASSKHDHQKRRWRQLDTMQFETFIECKVPRVNCKDHGVKQLKVPWAEQRSRFSLLFEQLAIALMQAAPLSHASKILRISWDQAAGIQERAVDRGERRREETSRHHIGIDETSFQKRHEYVTVITDKETGNVLDVLDDRKADTLVEWFQKQPEKNRKCIKTVSMDMWDAYIKAVEETIPDAENKICFDRFHVAQHLGKAVDKVRAQENRILKEEYGESQLKNTRHDWLRNSSKTDNRARRAFMVLTKSNLKTARAWAIKETASGLWDYSYIAVAEKNWMMLTRWMLLSRLEPMRKVARTIRKYLWGILNAILFKVTNALAESRNAGIQRIKKMACGFRNRKRFRMAILFHFGGLDMMPKGVSV